MFTALMAAVILLVLPAEGAGDFDGSPCVNRKATPVDPAVVGKRMRTHGCSRLTGGLRSELQVHNWGMIWQPEFNFHLAHTLTNGPACPEEITAVFGKRDAPVMLYHRPLTRATFFKDSHPDLYAIWIRNEFVQFPCNIIKATPVKAWGPQRKIFKKLVARMVGGIRAARGRSCMEFILNNPSGSVPASIVRKILARYAVANNAIAYLNNLAYSNFFCV